MALSRWLGLGAAVGIIAALVPVVRGTVDLGDPLGKRAAREARAKDPDLSGLDLTRLDMRPTHVSSPLSGGRTAELTLDPVVQRAALSVMKKYRVPEAGVVALEVKTGNVLAYASYVAEGEKFDVNARASAPAASVFKVVTSAALVEKAGLNADTEQCYHGGKSRIAADELKEDPERDKWCATLGIALGSSINVVFGRLAQKHLTPDDLRGMAGSFGFGAPVPFAIPNEASKVEIPNDPIEFARTAAGFWNTSLSPVEAAVLTQTVANGGVALKPRIVRSITRGKDTLWEAPEEPVVLRRALKKTTADEVGRMMVQTTVNGSAHKTFFDERGKPFLPGIEVAGKTGTLSDYKADRHYTWLVAYAPFDKPEIAVAALVVNTPEWQIKGPLLARETLRAYFAARGRPGVTAP
jgi:cell division protein FtsI/penicillin-binding protein 2